MIHEEAQGSRLGLSCVMQFFLGRYHISFSRSLRGPNGPALMAHERQYIANRSGRPPIHPWFYSVPEAIVQSQTLIEGYIRQIEHYIEGKPQRWWAMWDEEEGRVMRGTGSPPWDTLEQASDTAAPLAFSSDSCSEGPIKVSAERLGVSYEDAGRGAVTISGTGRPTSLTITSPMVNASGSAPSPRRQTRPRTGVRWKRMTPAGRRASATSHVAMMSRNPDS